VASEKNKPRGCNPWAFLFRAISFRTISFCNGETLAADQNEDGGNDGEDGTYFVFTLKIE
jgi:hypothetical protein